MSKVYATTQGNIIAITRMVLLSKAEGERLEKVIAEIRELEKWAN